MAEFDKLNRQVVKLVQSGSTPKVYVKAISDLEDFMNETIAKQKVSTKKMNATNARGLNAVKQRIKKNNKDFTKEIESYREGKEAYMESEDEDEVIAVEKVKKQAKTADASGAADDEGFSTVGRGGKTLQYTPESIFKNLRVIIESRGRKNTDRAEQIRVMERLFEVAMTPYQKIRVLLTLIATRFDLTTGSASFMSQEQWKMQVQRHCRLRSRPRADLQSGRRANSGLCSRSFTKTHPWSSSRTRKSGKTMTSHHLHLELERNYVFLVASCRLSNDLTMSLHARCNTSILTRPSTLSDWQMKALSTPISSKA